VDYKKINFSQFSPPVTRHITYIKLASVTLHELFPNFLNCLFQ